MISFVVYDPTGAIRQMLIVPEDAAPHQVAPPGCALLALEAAPPNRQTFFLNNYVAGGAVLPCASMTPTLDKATIAADGTDLATLSGLPKPCQVTISGALAAGPTPVRDGALQLTADHPGPITVAVSAPPAWLPWSVTLDAV